MPASTLTPSQRLRWLAQPHPTSPTRVSTLAPRSGALHRGPAARISERRRFHRVSVDLPLMNALRVGGANLGERRVTVRLLNLGAGGLRFACDQIVLPQTRLQLQLQLHADRPPLSVVLAVLECRRRTWGGNVPEPADGLEHVTGIYHVRTTFVNLPAADQALINRYVAERPPV